MTNGAGNVVKHVRLYNAPGPDGIIWVQFDHSHVAQKTRNDSQNLYTSGIEHAWTPIIPHGDTETDIVVDFSTKQSIPHIQYVGLSRVTTIEGLQIRNLNESKIS